ncbi:hypothetical protein [Kitasatospora phosalacinea]|uniref:hypothetical protein n=1 Tax=Kitasatospora phosalacinea TaxID=2065 RepID=UPI000527D631|nr:hypothetical protein [Kitasatospora phosalacinea]
MESTDNGISGGTFGSSLQAGTVNGGVHMGAAAQNSGHQDGMRDAYRTAYREFKVVLDAVRAMAYPTGEKPWSRLDETLRQSDARLVGAREQIDLFAPGGVRDEFLAVCGAITGIRVPVSFGVVFEILGAEGRRDEHLSPFVDKLEAAMKRFTSAVRKAEGWSD